jgi:protein-S-isoprenylcysteine O-methyltransferase Ste14
MNMTSIADFVIAFFNLLEAEGRVLRRSVMRLGWGLAFIVLAMLLLLAAAVFFLLGVYFYFAATSTPSAAALLVSGIALLLALVIAGIAYGRTR